MRAALRWAPPLLAGAALLPVLAASGREPAAPPALRAAADTTAPSSAWLALLPAGEEKRRFILDCTGCHAFDRGTAAPGGSFRDHGSWVARTAQMIEWAGAASGFPIISAYRDAEATAAWLTASLEGAAPPAPVPTATVEGLDEFPLPRPGDLPHDVAALADGRVVVTGMNSHVLYVLDPAGPTWSEIAIPVPEANPRAIEVDSAGDWWVVLGGPQAVARYRPSTATWDRWDLGMYPHEVALDGRGRVWFNGHFTKSPELLGVLDPATGAIETYAVPDGALPDGSSRIPYGLRVGPDGLVWMTELAGNRLVRFDPETEEFAAYPLPTPHSGPRRLDIAPDGSVWVPEYANDRLARFDPASATWTEYALPTADALPYVARVDARGIVWLGTSAGDLLARFDPATERFEEIPLPTRAALVRHLSIDPRTGDVWGAYAPFPAVAPKVFRLRAR